VADVPSEVRGVVNLNATSLTLLILLALGTFVAGVHAGPGASVRSASFLPLPCRRWLGPGIRHVDPGQRAAVGRRRCRILVDVASRKRASLTGTTQGPVIDLWIDYVSPYAFVAKAWAYQLEARLRH
jgi:hypothetical protein